MSKLSNGRILRPRQFVPVPADWIDDRMICEDWAGRPRWRGPFQHPEIANLVERHTALLDAGILRDGDRKTSARIEALLLHADEFFAWWFMQMNPERMLPDSPVRPAPETVLSSVPSWEVFIQLIGSVHRARAWIEAVEQRHKIEQPTVGRIWTEAYGVGLEEIVQADGSER